MATSIMKMWRPVFNSLATLIRIKDTLASNGREKTNDLGVKRETMPNAIRKRCL